MKKSTLQLMELPMLLLSLTACAQAGAGPAAAPVIVFEVLADTLFEPRSEFAAVVGRYRNFPGYHINTARTTPVVTSTVNGGAPNDVRIESAGSVTVTSGTAVTVDSNNAVTNAGNITVSNWGKLSFPFNHFFVNSSSNCFILN